MLTPLKCQSQLQQTINFAIILLIVEKKIRYDISWEFSALFVIFEKAAKFKIVFCGKL